jgi:hypothetical protein
MTDHPPGNRKSIDVLVAELRRFLASQDPEDDQADLVKYREKVIDVSLLFAPTPEESAAIAIREDTPSMTLVRMRDPAGHIEHSRDRIDQAPDSAT